jgi:ElaB/YqjD/DUF883 family membrane-anchored ribosome-binding protein
MDDTPRRVELDEVTGRGDASGATGRATDAGVDPQTSRRASEIRQEIEQTRDEMSETIEAIQEKLRPRNIVAHATESLKTATTERVRETTERVREMADTAGETAHDVMMQTREVAEGMMGSVRQNPIPAAMIGLGAAWLLLNRTGSRETPWRNSDYGGSDHAAEISGRPAYSNDDDSRLIDRLRSNPVPAALAGIGLGWLAFSASAGPSRRRFAGLTRENEYSNRWAEASDAGASHEGVATLAANVSESAERMAARAKEYAGETSLAIRQTGRRAQSQLQRMIEENPLLVGAGALMLGAAFGLAVPETERENEWMGETRDNVVEKAQELARHAASHVQEAAGSLTDAVTKK